MNHRKTFTKILAQFIKWHGVPTVQATAMANRIVCEGLGTMKDADWDVFLTRTPERAGDRAHWNTVRELVMSCYTTATNEAFAWLGEECDSK